MCVCVYNHVYTCVPTVFVSSCIQVWLFAPQSVFQAMSVNEMFPITDSSRKLVATLQDLQSVSAEIFSAHMHLNVTLSCLCKDFVL